MSSHPGITQIEMVFIIFIPVLALAITLHCCLKYWKQKKDRLRHEIMECHDEVLWNRKKTVRYPEGDEYRKYSRVSNASRPSNAFPVTDGIRKPSQVSIESSKRKSSGDVGRDKRKQSNVSGGDISRKNSRVAIGLKKESLAVPIADV